MTDLTRRPLLGLLLASLVPELHAQAWPARPIRIVVPSPPGGINDTVARLIASKLHERLGQPVVVENKAGANGIIGNEYVARSAADGHTLLFATSSLPISAHLQKVPYDARAAFAPVNLLALSSSILAVHPSIPATTLAEFIAYAKGRPNALNNGAGSTISQVGAEMFKQMAGVQIVSVPYKGSAPAVQGLVAGETQMIFVDTATALPHIKSGRLKPLAVTWPRRLAVLPDVPTFPEAGMPDYEFYAWLGLFAPAGTPTDVVAKLNAEVNAVLQREDIRAALGSVNEPVMGPPQALGDAYRKDLDRFGRVIKEANIKSE